MTEQLAPFPAFGGKRSVTGVVWERFGTPKQYIEPFCFSAAMLLAAPRPASLEVINDLNGFVANFWRAVKHQATTVAEWADYPVSHVDLGGRHKWLMDQRDYLGAELQDPNWVGDAKIAGWWLWGQCCWIGSGWCDWFRDDVGKVPHAGDAGRGIQAIGKVPHAGDAGRGFMTSSGAVAFRWLNELAARLERVRVTHGSWDRCLNNHYGDTETAVFLDPPYRGYEKLYGEAKPAADEAAEWCLEHGDIRICLCGHIGDYDLPGWEAHQWSRGRQTYSGKNTTDKECLWFSPACLRPSKIVQQSLFAEAAT